eukprot:IDg9418t1
MATIKLTVDGRHAISVMISIATELDSLQLLSAYAAIMLRTMFYFSLHRLGRSVSHTSTKWFTALRPRLGYIPDPIIRGESNLFSAGCPPRVTLAGLQTRLLITTSSIPASQPTSDSD